MDSIIFLGAAAGKADQEIQPLWNPSNWNFGIPLVTVDTLLRRNLCGRAAGTATSPNRILMMDYRGSTAVRPLPHMLRFTSHPTAESAGSRERPEMVALVHHANDGDMVSVMTGQNSAFVGNGGVNLKTASPTTTGKNSTSSRM